ncbi:MAG: hypothetical protein ABIY71_10250, partial [Flavobacteriales bacterium]
MNPTYGSAVSQQSEALGHAQPHPSFMTTFDIPNPLKMRYVNYLSASVAIAVVLASCSRVEEKTTVRP